MARCGCRGGGPQSGRETVRGSYRPISAVTIGDLPDGCPVVVSGGGDGTVRVCRLADGTPLVLSASVGPSPFMAKSS